MAFGEDEAQSVMQLVGDVRDLRVKQVIEESLTHSNFIRLDFKLNAGVTVPAVEEPEAPAVSATHAVVMTYELARSLEERVEGRDAADVLEPKPVDARITRRLTNGGNILMGCAENAGLGVDLQMGEKGEVATRQVLVRLSQSGGKNFAVVERLSPDYPTEVYSVDEKGFMTVLPGRGGIDLVEVPSDKKMSVRIGLGRAQHLELSDDGISAPAESKGGVSREIPEAELPAFPIEMSRYRLTLSFTPKAKAE
jgi:hypothetical protein